MELKEVLDKYGKTPLLFANYYKYVFTFKAEVNDMTLYATYGGDADGIYRVDVNRDSTECLEKMEATNIELWKDGERIFSWSESW